MHTNNITQGIRIKAGKLLYTSIVINATPAKVWEVLTNFNSYPDWNPFIRSINGTPAPANNFQVTLQPPNSKPILMKPRVLVFEQQKELRWIGSLGIPYLFDGEHVFRLEENSNGSTTLHHFERFRGILIPFLSTLIEKTTQEGFELMNAALKQRLEKQ
jgi:hypothetical protein